MDYNAKGWEISREESREDRREDSREGNREDTKEDSREVSREGLAHRWSRLIITCPRRLAPPP